MFASSSNPERCTYFRSPTPTTTARPPLSGGDITSSHRSHMGPYPNWHHPHSASSRTLSVSHHHIRTQFPLPCLVPSPSLSLSGQLPRGIGTQGFPARSGLPFPTPAFVADSRLRGRNPWDPQALRLTGENYPARTPTNTSSHQLQLHQTAPSSPR